MSHFFKLMDDKPIPGRWHVGDVLTFDGAELMFDAGIEHEVKPLVAEVTHPGRSLDFCLSAFNVPIARDALAEAIASVAGPDVQCLPVLVGKQSGFSVLNARRLLRCIDDDRSESLKWTERDHRPDLIGQYRMVPRLRLNARLIPEDAHFFRLKDWEVALIVSEQVKIAMERAGCLGAKFQEVTGASELS